MNGQMLDNNFNVSEIKVQKRQHSDFRSRTVSKQEVGDSPGLKFRKTCQNFDRGD